MKTAKKDLRELPLNEGVEFSQLTNKSKRKVYKEISSRYNGNEIAKGVKFDFNRDIPIMAADYFRNYRQLFFSYKNYGANNHQQGN
jgi:hypothetical protein